MIAETNLEALRIFEVSIFVEYGNASDLVLIAITTSSRAALPALSPSPFIVHSICLAPASTPASELATAKPRSLWQWVEKITLSAPGTFSIRVFIRLLNSLGIEYPTVSGILIVVAPFLIATSTHLHKKSTGVRVASIPDHSTSSTRFLA